MPRHTPSTTVPADHRWSHHFEVTRPDVLEALRFGALPLGLGTPATNHVYFRDQFWDTPEALLDARGVRCRVRHEADGRQWLSIQGLDAARDARHPSRVSSLSLEITGRSFADIARADLPITRALRALVEPARLDTALEVQVERHARSARWFGWPTPCIDIAVDHVRVANGAPDHSWIDLRVQAAGGLGPSAARVAQALATTHDLLPTVPSPMQRAREVGMQRDRAAWSATLQQARECVVLLVTDHVIGLRRSTDGLAAFWGPAAGEAGCRDVLHVTFGSRQGQVRCLGTIPERPWRPALEIWMARQLPDDVRGREQIEWMSLSRAIGLAGSPLLRDWRALAALHIAARSDLLRELAMTSERLMPIPSSSAIDATVPAAPGRSLDADISLLAFNARVLALAQDATIDPSRRLGYLTIVAGNLDEFFMVRMGALKRALQEPSPGMSSTSSLAPGLLDAVRVRAHALYHDMHRTLQTQVLPALATEGTHLREWSDLDPDEQARLTNLFFAEVRPRLNPMAAARSLSFPHLGTAELALALSLRDPSSDREHFATMTLPTQVPRVFPLTSPGGWILLESLVCAHSTAFFRNLTLVHAHAFRITRSADVRYDDAVDADVLHLVEDAIERRAFLPVVRMEVERRMPMEMRLRLLQAFRFERPDRVSDLEAHDIVDVDGMLALRGLDAMANALQCRVPASGRQPFAADRDVFADVRSRDVLVHLPYDSFQDSVQRFLEAAADDPAVESVKLTLYRTNRNSPIIDALFRARAAGKTVVVFVELKARFDESRNIEHARALAAAGIQVVYGVPRLKLHAKLLLVLRRDEDALRHYAYIGTGNFNPVTSQSYTDLGLFTARPEVTDELFELLNALAGVTTWPDFRELLVSPVHMLSRLGTLIRREADHARHGRPSGLRLKVNGLDDPELIEALYEASAAGVPCQLSVRGICTLRPGVPGLSDRIRVVSILGEFLEHARVVHFVNGGVDEYYIGSADWRERNLRRRVEVAVPVRDDTSRARLDHLLALEQRDSSAWVLDSSGEWTRGASADAPDATQHQLLQELRHDVRLR